MANTEAGLLEEIRTGYQFDGPTVRLGAAMVEDQAHPDVHVQLPLAMMNRHGLVAGATGTGKTVTLQVIAEQLSAHGVPVFLADLKGDLTGLSTPADGGAKLRERVASVGQDWSGKAFPVEYFSLGGDGKGVPVRARVSDFGPLLLARVMDLNETQESSLQLVFHYADQNDLELYNLADLRAVIRFLMSDDGKEQLEALGALSKSTAGVILRELVSLEAQGMDRFFGEAEFDTSELLRRTPGGQGIISCLELPTLQGKPALFSTFLMWLLADLFAELPEVGDLDKPKLVFFLDEAHLLFRGASKAFLQSIMTTVRLIRSKGVGIFFVTQTPKDVPSEVLGQLANRIQHALRAFTPDDAKALKATVSTFPISGYDLEEILTSAGIGEAVVTVMNERGAPTPVALTRMFAPESTIGPSPAGTVEELVKQSPLLAVYGPAVDSHSAFEKLSGATEPARVPAEITTTQKPAPAPATQSDIDAEARRIEEDILGRPSSRPATPPPSPLPRSVPAGKASRPGSVEAGRERRRTHPPSSRKQEPQNETADMIRDVAMQAATTLGRELVRGLFGTRRRRRRW
ncbi:hypothetical protein D477_012096 [Arthrobacter crystallopoietes BAB-32]|uniref:Helicase HerA-like C-terminal domain-containing protein n=1 Tax=Arthrobacter crystallopoietes BAB-32 TaxID=1246476 RepID=N1V6U9_9MICC|nr:helicase HerA-like domain-containing protein [Arthrobacter crystallopoietes]EMY33983.1 hypothetical protein D477_012096 [Arthrobacter crystallopoietes BAB-32]